METTSETTKEGTANSKGKRRMRWWIPATIIALAMANGIRVRMSDDLDSNFKNMQTMSMIAVFHTADAGLVCAADQTALAHAIDWTGVVRPLRGRFEADRALRRLG